MSNDLIWSLSVYWVIKKSSVFQFISTFGIRKVLNLEDSGGKKGIFPNQLQWQCKIYTILHNLSHWFLEIFL